MADRVWTLDDLQILHELRTPVTVVIPDVVEQTHERYSKQGSDLLWCEP